ncbi:MAG: SPASM domain-containing protein [Chloroflexi bacterium]|nr:SPASM domain-containing protein [Chloroflexota bacterium]
MPEIQDSTLIDKKENLATYRRDERMLVIDPDSSSWQVLSGDFVQVFSRLRRGQPFSSLVSDHTGLNPDGLRFFIDDLFKHGFVRLNGRYFPEKINIWDNRHIMPTLTVDLGSPCSLLCPGCKRGDVKTSGFGADEILHAGWDSVYNIIFGGGEPLLNPALPGIIKDLYNKADGRVRLLIQTGGIPLEEDMLEILACCRVNMIFRLDGPLEIHDRRRILPDGSGSFLKTREALQKAKDRRIEVGAMSQIQSPDELIPVLEYFISEGLTQAAISLATPGELREAAWEEWGKAQIKALEYLKHKNETDSSIFHLYDLKHLIRGLISPQRVYPCRFSPCAAGSRVKYMGADGRVYPCRELIECGASADKDELASRTVDSLPRCRRCAFRNICAGGCPARAYSEYGTIMREDASCAYMRYMIPELMWLIYENPGIPAAMGVNVS